MSRKGESLDNSTTKVELIKWFSELRKESVDIVGRKGANLGEIYNLKFPVPPGFVVTAQAYDYFIENSNLKDKIKILLGNINYEDSKALSETTEKIRKYIIEAEMPEDMEEEIIEAYENLGTSDLSSVQGSALDILHNAHEPIFVAVRSSATTKDLEEASFIEEQNSFLNIKGNQELITHIKKCFASLFNPRATYHRDKQGFKDPNVNLAVVVQKMVDSTKSGIILSKDENYKNDNIILEAVWGLGEGIFSDAITPDKYLINRENIEPLDIKVSDKKIAITRDSSGSKTVVKLREERSTQQVLNKNEIVILSELALKLEEHYKRPQEIEFAIEGGDIYLVETKTIKTLEKQHENIKKTVETKKQEINEEVKPVTVNTKTKIKIAINSPSFAEKASKTGLKSVGLARIEDIIEESGKHPNYYLTKGNIKEYEESIFEGIRKIAEHFEEIWVKTSDIRSDELLNLEGAPQEKETNPMLGLRGIRFGLKNQKILEAELNALKRISESGKNIGIILPKITSVQEIKKVKEILNKINFNNSQLGVMLDTPAAIQIISQLCDEGIKFISFEINDLTQYMLGVDKENKEVKGLYNEMHPAILYQLAYVIRVCKKRNVKTNICIQNINEKQMIKFLVENYIDSICISPGSASEIAEYIKEIEDEQIKGTDKEPRKYTPQEKIGGEIPSIKGIEKLQER